MEILNAYDILDSIFGETEKILSRLSQPQNRYINEGIE